MKLLDRDPATRLQNPPQIKVILRLFTFHPFRRSSLNFIYYFITFFVCDNFTNFFFRHIHSLRRLIGNFFLRKSSHLHGYLRWKAKMILEMWMNHSYLSLSKSKMMMKALEILKKLTMVSLKDLLIKELVDKKTICKLAPTFWSIENMMYSTLTTTERIALWYLYSFWMLVARPFHWSSCILFPLTWT